MYFVLKEFLMMIFILKEVQTGKKQNKEGKEYEKKYLFCFFIQIKAGCLNI